MNVPSMKQSNYRILCLFILFITQVICLNKNFKLNVKNMNKQILNQYSITHLPPLHAFNSVSYNDNAMKQFDYSKQSDEIMKILSVTLLLPYKAAQFIENNLILTFTKRFFIILTAGLIVAMFTKLITSAATDFNDKNGIIQSFLKKPNLDSLNIAIQKMVRNQ